MNGGASSGEEAVAADKPLAESGLVTAREAAALGDGGLRTINDLLHHIPRRYEDRRRFEAFPNGPGDAPVCLKGVVEGARRKHSRGGGFSEVVVKDGSGGVFGSGEVVLRWFHSPYIHRMFAAGQGIIAYGTVKEYGGRLFLDHPDFEILSGPDEDGCSIHLGRVVAVHRSVNGVTARRMREIIHTALLRVDPAGVDWLPDPDPAVLAADLLRMVHEPADVEEATAARRRLALAENFAVQLNAAWRRARHRESGGKSQGRRTSLLAALYHSLPFDLTDAQKRVIREIVADMRSPLPMNRLVQGDVGCGKTLVAMAAMLLAVESGHDAVLMAPTQILAEQHFLTFRRLLEPLGVRVRLRTALRDEAAGPPRADRAEIVIGTHALLYGARDDSRGPGLVVIDEQHRFGVAQRAALAEQGNTPDVLVMSATPIPRTLAMTVCGDLDVSVIDGKPPGRGEVTTVLREGVKQRELTAFVRGRLEQGRQAYLVYPIIEESETQKAESAVEGHAKWQRRLAGYEVGLLHGKLPPDEKERVMDAFRTGRIHALVSTTVIEVGVDVPNASLLVLHHAGRFGLAQIHQLRGRIGRGGHRGHCILLAAAGDRDAVERLRILERTNDGFEIAEEDMRVRGPGNVIGTVQSGAGGFRFPEFLADTALVCEARAHADRILAEDPRLEGAHARLRPLIGGGDDARPLAPAI
jgi:ATP-dependent DNA helicase RecG